MPDELDIIDNFDDVDSPNSDGANSHRSSKPPAVNTVKERTDAVSSSFEWIQVFLVPLMIIIILMTFVFRIVNVDGTSMMNTLHDSDLVLVTNFLYEPENGDIVVISHGQEYATPIIKRIIAKAGQTVKIDYENNQVIVDGVAIDEPYLPEAMIDNPSENNQEIPEVIPEGKIFVMGDNRNHSSDSRSQRIGLINETDVIGKAQLIFFPFNRFGYLY